MRFDWLVPPLLAFPLVLAACGGGGSSATGGAGGTGTNASGGSGGNGTGGGSTAALCTMPTPVTCADQVILQMNFQPDVSPGEITNTPDGAGWTSNIDATAGGAFASKPDSYTYGKFTDQGLQKVSISDEDSLDSMDWDVAFRRYVVRSNSADSGPSCVQAARVPGTAKYEDITAVPDNLSYHPDDTFTDSCDLIPDGSGLPDSPATALSSYWTYPGCVQMTHHVFVIALADGRHVKLTVDDYYSPAVQEQCDTTGSIPMTNTGSANFVVRWAFLP
ncbi:MAG: HmuY family protein [Minicystis sp.]